MTDAPGPAVIPSISYRDAHAAINWLIHALGFETISIHEAPAGGVAFGLLRWRGGMIFVSSHPEEGPWTSMGPAMTCLAAENAAVVQDCAERAVAAGAHFIRPLHISRSPAFPHGVSQFDLQDPEGHFWTVSNFRPH